MLLFVVAYLGGVLTILSPCILPVLPFVFARGDRPFMSNGLPLLIGMALTFAGVASLAAVGGGWAVQANQYGRMVAIVLMALFGLALLLPGLSERLARPLVGWGERLSASAEAGADGAPRSAFGTSLLLGVATGLLWAPCAGPILGLVLTGAALGGASVRTSLLLLAYAAGAATPLAGALLAGGRLFKAMKQSLGAGEWIRRGIGAALLCGVAAIALGLDTGVLAQLSLAGTSSVEQALIDRVRPREAAPSGDEAPLATTGPDSTVMMAGSNAMMAANAAMRAEGAAATALPAEGPAPSLDGAVQWLNSPPLSMEALRGKVVLIDFWTYSCINCLRALPYVRAWAEKYKDEGLVVIGVHAPEFAFEKKLDNVRKAVKDLKLDYPVAVDNDYAIWRAFKNEYWPAHYFIDARGRIRHHHFGEGAYDESEQVIRQLLAEAGRGTMPGGLVQVEAQGAQAAADSANVRSPETYIGYERAENFVSPGGPVRGKAHAYTAPSRLEANQWALGGNWTVGGQSAVLDKARGRIAYRFHARDLHLVLGSTAPGHPVRIKVTIDGKPPGEDHGIDIDAQGKGVVDGQRLYQLVRQRGAVADRRFEIEFLDPGVEAFAFTFG
ncbi:cytochrome C biogenesis protein [Variovorax paradoxus]|jgi:cytochrome c biogenesis protein CcdA/thiol-disulfide isomerase/thioredoxin|uniref:cytochrome c biogenesis protein DipZ n=4 Tax=Variovorax paradoxus TaxID=34073 RepID=UPI0006E65C94|nr:cytochrome C biogenesis protein [Variovorax paradoxus]KPV11177.1 cytochrome C biogenesis protein [Variovorax paradoxus]KPV13086.1 cytochrome C biogenesis protein [Variovorax paradoxus]KPV21196.1 cytochrome C biogenesis protein [Variovorax paradoxus]